MFDASRAAITARIALATFKTDSAKVAWAFREIGADLVNANFRTSSVGDALASSSSDRNGIGGQRGHAASMNASSGNRCAKDTHAVR
jgi:hypothetical protein